MGAREYETDRPSSHDIPLGIGRNVKLKNVIVDLNARIADGVTLVNEKGLDHADGPSWCIRGGVIVVPRDAVVPEGTKV
jgi:glucose-1-phosphate adenylyltransferase